MTAETEDDAMKASRLDGVRGEFWIDNGPRAPGTVHYRDGELRVVTEGIVRTSRMYRPQDSSRGVRTISMTLEPADGVADFAPVPLLGTLDDGRTVTVVDARLTPEIPLETQSFWGRRVLLGVHAPTVATTFTKGRVALPQPHLWRKVLSATDPLEVRIGERSGTLRAVVDGEMAWVELALDHGLVDREWERRFWGRIVTLLRLWTHAALREDHVQLSPGADAGWVDLLYAGTKKSETITDSGSLLPPGALDLDTVGRALTEFDELAPVPDVASKHMTEGVTVELAVLANAAALEGLHRGTRAGDVPFPKVKRPRRIGKAAAQAATAALVEKCLLDPEDVQTALTRLTSTFSYFNQPTFEERLRDLLAPVLEVAPGLIGEEYLEAWIEDVRRARNMEAHRFARKPNEREAYRQRVDDYIQLSISTEWVLRIAVLLQLKVPPKLIHARLLDHNPFEYALANLDHAEDPPGSRLAEFRASRPRDTGAPPTG